MRCPSRPGTSYEIGGRPLPQVEPDSGARRDRGLPSDRRTGRGLRVGLRLLRRVAEKGREEPQPGEHADGRGSEPHAGVVVFAGGPWPAYPLRAAARAACRMAVMAGSSRRSASQARAEVEGGRSVTST